MSDARRFERSGSDDQGRGVSATYTHGYDEVIVESMATRTANVEAGFFLPYLRPGMRLLDVGCGPGTITVGLAAAVAPGDVVGIDREPSQIERARALAAEQGLTNVRFELAHAEEIPFPDGSFDAAFEHTLLEHVADPARIVREMHRVLTSGGVIGVADGDWNGFILAPHSDPVIDSLALYERVWQHNGGDPRLGHRNRAILREAGFVQIRTTGRTIEFDPRDSGWFADRLLSQAFADSVIGFGWTDRVTLERYARAVREWGQNPDAVEIGVIVQSVGRRA
jgi:ubiquinone/menaquinone biosynthesis C-methylase UbiE